jgi:hypothetical protein
LHPIRRNNGVGRGDGWG